MIRAGWLAVTVVVVALAASVARGQSSQPENEDSRFTFHRADDGYLRLDGRSGQVSNCIRRPAGWACGIVPDERLVLEAEIVRLQGENAALKRVLVSNNIALPSGIRPDAHLAKVDESGLWLPGRAEFQQVVAFFGTMWRRVVMMVAGAQKDMSRKTSRSANATS
jgi:hypothetical protein